MNISEEQEAGILPSISIYLSEQKLFSTLDDNGVGVIICDRRLRYKAVNQSIAEMHNVPMDAHLGHSLHQVIGGLAEKVVPQWETVLSTGRPVKNWEVIGQIPKRLGEGRWVHNFFPLKDRHGHVTHAGCFVVEIPSPPTDQSPLPGAGCKGLSSEDAQLSGPDACRDIRLTLRERQVLQLLAEGKSNKDVSSNLDISVRTVESFRARLMLKLQASSFAHLVHYAIRNNMVKL
jgi:DNA-binding CsgD family transcriptional regulator